jgi:large repetitive protein
MKKSVAFLVLIFLCLWGSFGFCAADSPQPDKVKLQADYGGLPLAFIKNQGQANEEVLYYLKGREGTIYFTKKGIVYDLIRKEVRRQESALGALLAAPENQETDVGTQNIAPDSPESDVGARRAVPNDPASTIQNQTLSCLSFTLKPQGANPDVQVIPQDELPGKVNYFIGNDPQNWHTNIPTYKSIIYQGLYPGIDLKVYGTNRQMEYDFIVHPGADPNQISLAGEGIDGLEVDTQGNLLIKTALTDIKHLTPKIYQEVDGKRLTVEGSFTTAQNRIGFDIKNYNKKYPLIIDPLTFSYSTYLGGTGYDYGNGIAVDSSGCAYVTGYTNSSNFPTANAYDSSFNSSYDVFVTKFTASGNGLVYSTYLGSSGNDCGYGIAIDSSGSAYVTGFTSSSNFPTASPYQGTKAGGDEVFVTKFSAAGTALSYSTFLGGSNNDYGWGIAVDSSGCAYVTGYTASSNFPTANAYQATSGGSNDIFVAKFAAAGSSLAYSTYLGSNGDDRGYGIAANSSGSAYVTGYTASSNFPTANAYDSSYNTNTDAFVTKFTASGNGLSYSTFLGGSSIDYGYAIAIDSSGCAYVTGYTLSSNFPTANAYDSSFNSSYEVFVSKFTAAGDGLFYSTYLGGNGTEKGYGIAVDSSGCAFVAGYTSSTNFPTENAFQETRSGGQDAFVTKFTAAGNGLSYSTYLGGSNIEYVQAIALDSQQCAYVTGYTISTDFPTVNPYQGSQSGYYYDAFVSKLTFCYDPVADFSGTPTSGNAPLTITFTDASTNSPTSWSWNFGDTGTSDLQNPSHQYTTPGTYTVSLTATNACNNDTETKTGYITVNACPVPVASFSAAPNEGCAPLSVAFTDTSTNNPTTWSWDFGDEGISDLQNPTHEYASPNTYTVTLIASNYGGSDSETTQIIVVPLSIDITSQQNGESFLASPITVTGTINCSGTEVTVNGQQATINGQQFTAENVPLVTGPNTITATASYEGSSNAQDSVSITLLVPQGPVQYFYDDLGRLIKAQDDAGHVIEYTYDSVGNRQTKTITVP